MPAIEKGRVCFLSRGRRAGKKAIIAEIEGGSIVTVIVDGKRKKCNARHLFPTREIVDISKLEKPPRQKKEQEKREK